jgi:hypothetical protein
VLKAAFMQNYRLLLLVLLVSFQSNAQFTDVINSNRPGRSMAAFSVGKSVFQAEGGTYFFREKHNLLETTSTGLGLEAVLRWGIYKEELEGIFETQYQGDQFVTPFGTENRRSLKSTIIGAKYLIYDPYKNYEEKPNIRSWKAKYKFKWRQLIPAIAVYGGFNLNFDNPYSFENDPIISPKLMVITQNQFNGGFVLITNIIADRVTTEFPSFGGVVTLTRGFSEKWSGFLESQFFSSNFYADVLFRSGAAYLVKENFQIDASITANLKDTPSVFYVGTGISWRFDSNYKPVLIRSGKDKDKDKDKDKKGKKKKKKKGKKTETPPTP